MLGSSIYRKTLVAIKLKYDSSVFSDGSGYRRYDMATKFTKTFYLI